MFSGWPPHPAKKWLLLGAAILLPGGILLLAWFTFRVFWDLARWCWQESARLFHEDKDHGKEDS
jgi:hypothetical protein